MDQEKSSYITDSAQSLFNKNNLSDLQNKTNLVENRLNNSSKILKEIRDRISELYYLYDTIQKDNIKLRDEILNITKKQKIIIKDISNLSVE